MSNNLNNKFDEIEFDQPLEEEIEEVQEKRKIYTNKSDPEIDSLYGKYKRVN